MRVRGSQAVSGDHLFRLPHREWGVQQQLAGRANPAQARIPDDLGTRAPEHPRTGNGSYVFEHVLVMEEMLGRYLLPGENVHHRNGVRDDNRPENLELWVTQQPTGIRGVDALAWAREIIARYGEVAFITQGN
jgi:hypothetical protein